MIKIRRFTCENLTANCVTDERQPVFSFSVDSNRQDTIIKRAVITVDDWITETKEQTAILYTGKRLQPFTVYKAHLKVWDDMDEKAEAELSFETGRMDTPWSAKWITDASYSFREKKCSPVPMCFQREFQVSKKVKSARIYATALGIYELMLNGKKVGSDFFAPGFTSYKTRLQYQTYDITEQLAEKNKIQVTVAGGWAVGSFGMTRKNRITADRQALLLEIHIYYEDNTCEVINTDENWKVTMQSNYSMADLYDGETYDALFKPEEAVWHDASEERLKISPDIIAMQGVPVRAKERLEPVKCVETDEGYIYDFGQNFAGVVALAIEGKRNQKIIVKHAELLKKDGTLNTSFLRTAKATITYICREGFQKYMPRFTYMGFRYICISGIPREKIRVSAYALYSDLEKNGDFWCSSEKINRLQKNILWSAKSNFVEIPTDCPQRDERMGWTGDIALFAPTACYNFAMHRFLKKWLLDMQAEQIRTGGIPNTIPSQGYGFPETMPVMAVEFWGDACILVPWAEYLASGDSNLLKSCFEMMKKYVDACCFWAGLLSFGKHRYIWNTLPTLHFGDWVAPDVPKMSQWQKRSRWTATASLQHTSDIFSRICGILGKEEEERKYRLISEKTAEAYVSLLLNRKVLKEEFQTAYVLPLAFGMLQGAKKEKTVSDLVRLVKEKQYCIGTGFPGTPYILFALADNGRADVAYDMLFNEKCPSWLYEVKMGATTIWERWDGLDESGECPIGEDGTDRMISYNHYASGAVGDFLYRKIAGIEVMEAGYRKFRIRPLLDYRISAARGYVETVYGEIVSDWWIEKKQFLINVHVPVGTTCMLQLPDGTEEELGNGIYDRTCSLG